MESHVELQTGVVYMRMDWMSNLYGVNLIFYESVESQVSRGKNL